MKKILLLAVFACAALSVSSQIRVEAGTSIGGFRGTTSNYSETAGVTAGAYYDLGFQSNPYEFLGIGLQFTQTGFESSGMDGMSSWIQLPIESRSRVAISDNLFLYVDAGFFFGYALSNSANIYWSYGGKPVCTDISDSVRKFNFGTSAGVGLGLGRLSLRFNWQRGFLNLMGPTPDDVFSTNDYRTNSWRFTIGMSI